MIFRGSGPVLLRSPHFVIFRLVRTHCPSPSVFTHGLMLFKISGNVWYEPSHGRSNKETYATSEDSDQPGHLPGQIRACADPESFVRGVLLLQSFFFLKIIYLFFYFLFFFDEWREDPNKYHYKRAIISPPSKRHLNGVSLVKWRFAGGLMMTQH